MKTKTFLPIVLCALLSLPFGEGWGGACFSQGNLQFNQVIFQNVTNASCYQVPAGKVFKLEGVLTSQGSNIALNVGTGCNAGIVGAIDPFQMALIGGSGSSQPLWRFPAWIPAGKYLFSSSATAIAISGIEFNIVP